MPIVAKHNLSRKSPNRNVRSAGVLSKKSGVANRNRPKVRKINFEMSDEDADWQNRMAEAAARLLLE